jgi:hypothetical protein
MLPPHEATRVRELLKDYLNLRVQFYESRDKQQLRHINAQTAQLQTELWSAVEAAADKQPRYPILVVSGVNDVLNSQGDTEAAWDFRWPIAAWGFMLAVAVFSTGLSGYSSHRKGVTFLWSYR